MGYGRFVKQDNNLKINNDVKSISDYEFELWGLKSVEFSNDVIFIGNCSFGFNEITSLELPKNLRSIGNKAFTNNKISSVCIPGSVFRIGNEAFKNNNLDTIILSEGVKVVGNEAFKNNNTSIIHIPKSVISIGKDAFNSDIVYDGVLLEKDLISTYGCENIIKLYEVSKFIPLKDIKNTISPWVLEVIPTTVDAIKGYYLNKKLFDNIINIYNIKKEEYQDIFKMSYVLGLFNNPSDEVKNFINKVIKENSEDYIHQMWTAITLNNFIPKFRDVFIKLYNEEKTEYNGQNIIGRLYSSFEKINKYTIKRHEEEISKKNSEIKRLKELGANTTLLEQELEILKQNKKDISYDDIVYYIKNNIFDIRPVNEELKDVASILSIHMDQQGFNIIQDIYEESRNVEKTIPFTNDTSNNDIKYHWSKSDNPINTVLGYLVNCCAKLGGAAEDIMHQSMINPDIANLIIYDENNQVMGKATAYYNRKGKYILFNNAETKAITSKGLKSAKQRQKECLQALIRGTMDAVNVLKERGEDVNEVRIGMLRNDLANVIEEYGLEISYELLQSYNWKDYDGDASDADKGQAIIYKDGELDKNRKI